MKNHARTHAMMVDAAVPVLLAIVAPCVLILLILIQDLLRGIPAMSNRSVRQITRRSRSGITAASH